jgi:hypothetical protein
MVLSSHKVSQNILTLRMICPVDLSPRKLYLICASFAKCVLSEEKHKASPVLVHRSALSLNQCYAFNHIYELNLLMARELGDT